MPSVGQAEQERAFQEWLAKGLRESGMDSLMPGGVVETLVRGAFAAGEERGQELRGCCQAHPGNGRLAVKERDG